MSRDIRHYILATAGHVDHGKSSLVRQLTGTDPDRLPEEKARGMTIDLGFASLELPSPPNAASAIYRIGIVDVPGHEDFIRNMVAGVGSVDLAMLVVAADDGWMPQTEEHLQILTYLGLQRGVVALTKVDCVAASTASIERHVRERLQASPLAEAPIIPVSAITGQGMDRLQAELARILADVPPQLDRGKPRLAIDRAFTLRGIGTVVTGTLSGGMLSRGQRILMQPGGVATRIRSLQSHHCELEQALPGTRLAMNLPDLCVRTSSTEHEPNSVGRGDVITINDLGTATDALDVLLHCMPRPNSTANAPAINLLRNGMHVHVHHGTARVSARIYLLDGECLTPGASAIARLRLESRLLALCGDRLVVRDSSARRTLAGGIVLECDAGRFPLRREPTRTFLRTRATAPHSAEVLITSQIARDHWACPKALNTRCVLPESDVLGVCRDLVSRSVAVSVGSRMIHAEYWRQAAATARRAVDNWHTRHPEQPGIPLDVLRQVLPKDLGDSEAFGAMIRSLTQDGYVQAAAVIGRATHRPSLPPRLQAAGQRLRAILEANRFDPPGRQQLAPDDVSRQALKFLVANGEAVELSPDLVISARALALATEAVTAWIRQHGPGTVSQLKAAVNASRRIMVPLLEKLDSLKVTRRSGDQRDLWQAIPANPPDHPAFR
ncbi:MAG: selenocysteine-specific translation elongation factor [Bacillota bacterium]